MKLTIIGIYDRKAQVFIEMSATPNTAVAMRNLAEVINGNSEHPIKKWPSDFELWELGRWDSETGEAWPRSSEHDFNDAKRNWDGDLDCYEKKLIIHCENLKNSQ